MSGSHRQKKILDGSGLDNEFSREKRRSHYPEKMERRINNNALLP